MKSAPVPLGEVAAPSSPTSRSPRRAEVDATAYVSSYDSDGMLALREGRFDAAAQYFERAARSQPDDAEGWAGIAASFVGIGDLGRAAQYLARAHRHQTDAHAPVALMLALGAGKRGDRLIDLARLLQEQRTAASWRAAIAALIPCLGAHAGVAITEGQRIKALEMRRDLECKLASHAPLAPAVPARANPRTSRLLHVAARVVTYLVVAALLGLALTWAWGAVQRARSQALVRLAASDYAEALRIERGQGRRVVTAALSDAVPLLLSAYAQSRDAARVDPASLEARVLLVETGEALLFRAARGTAVPAGTVAEARVAVRQARMELKTLDPRGVGQARERRRLGEEAAR